MPVTVQHVLTATTPDDPAYEIRPSHWNSAHLAALSATAGTEIYGAFSNDPAYNVSFTTNAGGQVVASANVTAAPSPVNVTGANGSSVNAQTVAFSNSNGLTLGVSTAANGATVTGSYTVPSTAGLLSAVNISAGTTSNNLSALTFSNANGISFGLNASTVTASYTVPTVPTSYVSQVNGSSGAISFATGSSLSSSSNGSTITWGLASNITTALQSAGAYLTTARASNDAVGLNSAVSNVTATINSSGLSLDARGYAGTATAVTGAASLTVNSGGVSFNGSSLAGVGTTFNGANISGSMTVNTAGINLSMSVAGAGGAASQTMYATGNTTVNSSGTAPLSSLLSRAYGILSIGTSNGSVLFSTPDASDFTALSVGFSTGGNTAGDTGLVTGRLVLAGGANITLSGSTNGGSQTISIVGGAGGGVTPVVSANNGSYSFTTLSLSNANGISFGTSAGSAITASHNALTSQSNQAFSAAGGSSAFQTLGFSDNANASFTNTNGSVAIASVRASLYATSNTTQSSSITQNLNSLIFAGAGGASVGASNGSIVISAPTGGGVNPAASASNGSFSFTTLNFSNANNVTFGTSAGSIITASVAAPGAAAENNWVNLLGANTAGNTTASGSTIGYSGINLTLSGTNGSVVNISAPATSSLVGTNGVSISTNGSTISVMGDPTYYSYFNPQDAYVQITGQQGQGSLHIQPAKFPNLVHDRIAIPMVNTNSSNSSGSHTISFWVGIYSRNASSLSLVQSTSSSTAVTHSGTAGSYSLYSGIRLFTIPHTSTVTEGQYWIGVLSRTTSGGANGSYSQILASQQNSSFFGHFGSSVDSTMQYTRGLGVYSATTSAIPNSIAFSQISGASNSLVLRQPILYWVNGTI